MSGKNQYVIFPLETQHPSIPFSKELTLLLLLPPHDEAKHSLTFIFEDNEVKECKDDIIKGKLACSITFVFREYREQVSFRMRYNNSMHKVTLELYQPILAHPCKGMPSEDMLDNYILFERDLKIIDVDGNEVKQTQSEFVSLLMDHENLKGLPIYWLEGSTAHGKTTFLTTLIQALRDKASIYRVNFYNIIRFWVDAKHNRVAASVSILDFIQCIRLNIQHNKDKCLNEYKSDYKKRYGKNNEEMNEIVDSMFKAMRNSHESISVFIIDEIDILFSYYQESPIIVSYLLRELMNIFVLEKKYVILFSDNMAWSKRNDNQTKKIFFSYDLGVEFNSIQQAKLLPITVESIRNYWEKMYFLSQDEQKYWRRKSSKLYNETRGNALLLMSIVNEIIEQKKSGSQPIWSNVTQGEKIKEAIRYLCQKSCLGGDRMRISWSDDVYRLLIGLKNSPLGLNPTEIKEDRNEFTLDSLLSLGIIYWDDETYKLVPIVKKHLDIFIKECKAGQDKEAGNDSN